MEYEDRLAISTPEGVELELALAGLGSRFIAATVDTLIRWLLLVAVVVVLIGAGALGGGSGIGRDRPLAIAALAIVFFLIWWGYDVLFEVLGSGRTPGKRWTGLRVVRVGGHPIGWRTSAVRNLLRIVDGLPFLYGVGIASILISRRNQRLGDHAAGAVVIRERRGPKPSSQPLYMQQPAGIAGHAWDVSAVTVEEVSAVRSFLERRATLEARARDRLASTLADRLAPKVGGLQPGLSAEAFLEQLALTKSAGR